MAGRVLVDTNILLDYVLTREPFYEDAKQIIAACTEGKVQGCIAAHSVSNMFYILRKDYSEKERREVSAILPKEYLTVAGIQRQQEDNFS